jgi:hypothetical protein
MEQLCLEGIKNSPYDKYNFLIFFLNPTYVCSFRKTADVPAVVQLRSGPVKRVPVHLLCGSCNLNPQGRVRFGIGERRLTPYVMAVMQRVHLHFQFVIL